MSDGIRTAPIAETARDPLGRSAEPLIAIATQAVAAADPAEAVRAALPPAPAQGRVVALAFGKAAVPMALAVEAAWGPALGDRLSGVAVTNDPDDRRLRRLETLAASHPTPDAASEAAARRLLAEATALGPEDFALVLVSGGGSALLSAPAEGLSLADKQAVTRQLLARGATIHEINTVRKRLSAIKGGRLAAAIHPAASLTLALSDVPGDDPSVIASGPTAPDPSSSAAAREIAERFQLRLAGPSTAEAAGESSGAPVWRLTLEETPKPGDPIFERAALRIIASPRLMVDRAVAVAAALGYRVRRLGDELEGEARAVGRAHGLIALAEASGPGKVALISGGELTVTLTGDGRGGPNREYALALARTLAGRPGVSALAMDTDGADGAPSSDGKPVAGALIFCDTLTRAAELGLDPAAALARNDAGGFFESLGDALSTGYTGTNVNDLRVILIDG